MLQQLLGTVMLPEGANASATFGTDDRTVVITSDYESVYRWDTSTAHALDFACTLAGRDFTRAEWEEAFGGRPYQQTCPQS